MPINIDDTYTPRVWRCEECRAILGYVLRESDRVRRVWVLHSHLAANKTPMPSAEIFAAVQTTHTRLWSVRGMSAADGKGHGVVCRFCGSVNEWNFSAEALAELISRMRGEQAAKRFREMNRNA